MIEPAACPSYPLNWQDGILKVYITSPNDFGIIRTVQGVNSSPNSHSSSSFLAALIQIHDRNRSFLIAVVDRPRVVVSQSMNKEIG